VTEDFIYKFLEVSTYFWKQILEIQPKNFSSFDDFENFSNNVVSQLKSSRPHLQVSLTDYLVFENYLNLNSALSPINDKIDQICQKCNNVDKTNVSFQLQKIEENIDEFNLLLSSKFSKSDLLFRHKTSYLLLFLLYHHD
jgi:hypothetical protein